MAALLAGLVGPASGSPSPSDGERTEGIAGYELFLASGEIRRPPDALAPDDAAPWQPPPGDAGARRLFTRPGEWSRSRKSNVLNVGIVAVAAAYGFSMWDWGESGFGFEREGWFGRDTGHGGADKLGHAYAGAVTTAISASLHRRWGYDDEAAARRGAITGLVLTTAVEIGDGFSPDHGFSWEDQAVNMAGVGFEYLRQRHPALRERVHLRWEYFPSPAVRHGEHADILTDYSGSRWLLAFPLHAWGARDNALRWFELHIGYGTRGFAGRDRRYFDVPRRHPYIGIGLHMPRVIRKLGWSSASGRAFEYLQIPGTAWPLPP